MEIRFRKPDNLPPREQWYRMPEREKRSPGYTPPEIKYREGDFICTNRIIVRVGYYWQPHDMPTDLLQERAINHLINATNAALGSPWTTSLRRMIQSVHPLRYSEPISGIVGTDLIYAILEALGWDDSPAPWRHLEYRLRWDWVTQQELPEGAKDIRTFWYINDPDSVQQVNDIRTRLIGRRWGASTTYGDYGGQVDYDPPSFEQWSTHRLYTLRNWEGGRANTFYIHPLDVIERS